MEPPREAGGEEKEEEKRKEGYPTPLQHVRVGRRKIRLDRTSRPLEVSTTLLHYFSSSSAESLDSG